MNADHGYFDWKIAADGVVEVSVEDGVELSRDMVEKAFVIIGEAMPRKYCVLAQRREGYGHTLESMVALSELDEVLMYAVFVSNVSERELGMSHKIINPKVQLFNDRESALAACLETLRNYSSQAS